MEKGNLLYEGKAKKVYETENPDILIAVQPTRGLDVGAIEYIHKQIIAHMDAGHAVLLVSLELEEVMSISDRILVMYEGEIVGELDPKVTKRDELGLYMAGARRNTGPGGQRTQAESASAGAFEESEKEVS